MSIETMSVVLNNAHDLDPTSKLVLLGIANHDGDGGAWPSVETLMRYANASESTVHRRLALLEKGGYIVRHVQEGGDRRTRPDRRPNLYEIVLSRVIHTPDSRGVTADTPCDPRGVSSDTHGVSAVTPEPSFNHPYTNKRTDSVGEHLERACFCFPRKARRERRCPTHGGAEP